MRKLSLNQISIMNIHYANYSLGYFFRSAAQNGFQSISFWGGPPHFFIDAYSFSDLDIIKKLSCEYSLSIDCFTTPSCSYGYQFGMQPEEMRQFSLRYFQNGILVAAELGCKWMSVNSGWGYFNENIEVGFQRSREMLSSLADYAKRYGVILTLENLRGEETKLAHRRFQVEKLIKEVNHPNLKAMLDTTALRVANENIEDWFLTFGNSICNMHFIDSSPYGHLIWGDGNTNLQHFITCLEENNYSGLLGLEITDKRYFADPSNADRKCMNILKQYIS